MIHVVNERLLSDLLPKSDVLDWKYSVNITTNFSDSIW
jgi:hypothetical protein